MWGMVFIVLHLPFVSHGKELVLDDSTKMEILTPYFQYIEEIDGRTYSLDDVMSTSLDFKTIATGKHSLGRNLSKIWIKASIRNNSNHRHWSLLAQRSQFKQFRVHLLRDDGSISTVKLGQQREGLRGGRLPELNISLKEKERITLVIEAQHYRILNLYMLFGHENSVKRHSNTGNMILFGSLGVIFALLSYNLMLYFSLKEKSYLYYVLFAASMISVVAFNTGIWDYFNIEVSGWFGNEQDVGFLILPVVAALTFTREFLGFKEYRPVLNGIYTGFIGLTLTFFVIELFYHMSFFEDLVISFYGITIVIFITSGILEVRRGNSYAVFFLLAWGFFAVGTAMWILSVKGVLQRNLFTLNGALIGNVLEMIFMSLGLASKISMMRTEVQNSRGKLDENDNLHRMVRALCHDISNPLSVISGSSEIAKDPISDKLNKKLWQKVSRSSEFIDEIITNVRMMESLTTNKVSLQMEGVSINECISDAKILFQDKADAKQIQLDFYDGEDIFVLADRTSLKHYVINNIISNAIKFTRTGGVIRLMLEPSAEFVTIKIIDSGIGIPKELQEKLFDPFTATTRLGTHKEKGTGFGMPLVKDFVEKFGGSLTINSITEDQDPDASGTEVIITLSKTAEKLVIGG